MTENEQNPSPENSEKPTSPQSEVRYVPIDYLPEFREDANEQVDIVELVKFVWSKRTTIVKITSIFAFLGVFWALISPVEYESEAILMPEVQETGINSSASGLLKQFGLGGGLGAGLQEGMIPPTLYPKIVNSLSFQKELLEQELYFQEYNVKTTWTDFLENVHSKKWTSVIRTYTVKLPLTILKGVLKAVSPKPHTPTDMLEDKKKESYITLSKEEFELIEELKGRIEVTQDIETGLLTSKVKLQDARAAAELNGKVIELLKEYVTNYRIDKARKNLEFAETQKADARNSFERSQLALASFIDVNKTLSTAKARVEQEQLQDEKSLRFQVYSTLAQRVEEAKLALQEQTPVFSVIQGVNIPIKKSEPRRAVIVIVFVFVGLIVSKGVYVVKYIINFSI